MQLITFEFPYVYFFSESFSLGYTFFCLLLLAGRLFARGELRQRLVNYHAAVNLCFALGAIILVIFQSVYVYEYWQFSMDESEYEQFAFFEAGPVQNVFSDKTLLWLAIGTLLASLAGFLFFIKKLRVSWVISVLIIALLHAYFIMLLIRVLTGEPFSFYTDLDRELIPVYIFAFGVLSWLVYRWLSQRKKLPHPPAGVR